MPRLVVFFAFLFVAFATAPAFSAGYSCPAYMKYTSCLAGYYMTNGGSYNGTPVTGNTCTACPAGYTCAGGTANMVASCTATVSCGTGSSCSGTCGGNCTSCACNSGWNSWDGGRCYYSARDQICHDDGTGGSRHGVFKYNIDGGCGYFSHCSSGYDSWDGGRCYYSARGQACSIANGSGAYDNEGNCVINGCNMGYYKSGNSCTSCIGPGGPGTRSCNYETGFPETCYAGYGHISGVYFCGICQNGTYMDTINNNLMNCKACPDGLTSGSGAQTGCSISLCPANSTGIPGTPQYCSCHPGYQDGATDDNVTIYNSGENCSTCQAGFYCNGTAWQVRQTCPAGWHCPAGSSTYSYCSFQAGYYAENGANTGSTACNKVKPDNSYGVCWTSPGGIKYTANLDIDKTNSATWGTPEVPGYTSYVYAAAECNTYADFACKPGYYRSSSANGVYSASGTACQTCPAGSYCSGGNASPAACTGATYSGAGAGSCAACPAGYTANTTAGKTAAAQCQISVGSGQYIATANAGASTCPAGYSCAGGTINYGVTGNLAICPAGTYSGAGAGSCTGCPAIPGDNFKGYNQTPSSDAGSGAVTSCFALYMGRWATNGYWQNGNTRCYYINGDYTNCTKTYANCQVGYHLDSSNPPAGFANSCKPCGAGSYSFCPGGIALWDPIGGTSDPSYGISYGAESCTLCAAGTYQDATGQPSCKSCPAGYTANTAAGKTAATQCQINVGGGQYLATAGSGGSLPCAAGTSKPAHTLNYGATSACAACAAATYAPAGSGTCTSCPSYEDAANGYHGANVSSDAGAGAVTDCYMSNISSDWWMFERENKGYWRSNGKCYYGATNRYNNCTSPKRFSECFAGYYINNSVSAGADFTNSCTPCPAGTYTVALNSIGLIGIQTTYHYSTSCTACSADTYSTTPLATGAFVCNSCPAATVSPAGSDEAADCGRRLHIGDSILYLRSAKKTTPSLNVGVNGTVYYGNMTPGSSKGALRVNYGGTTYSVHDDSM